MIRKLTLARLLVIFLLFSAWQPAKGAEAISLDGRWAFRMDPQDRGLEAKWQDTALPDKIELPGALQAQGYGEEVSTATRWVGGIVDRSWFDAPEYEKYRRPGNIKVPFWLQPERHYVGAAWYQREFEIPADWKGKHVSLSLERPHWETRAWVDGKPFGRCESLSTPHVYHFNELPPGKHTLTLRVDNRLIVDVGENTHSVSDHTQSDWNGIVGKIELRPHDPVWIESQAVFANIDNTVRMKVRIRNDSIEPVSGEFFAGVYLGQDRGVLDGGKCKFELPGGTRSEDGNIVGARIEKEISIDLKHLPNLWSEFTPRLYTAVSFLSTNPSNYTFTRVGFREIGTQGTQFTLNGNKIFFRGTLECCIFPLTGYPPTDVESWRRIIRIAKTHGLNLIRFHSWCPPEAAFVAADELGFYFQVECAAWATVGDGKPIDKWLYDEAERIIEAYGNHPSFVLMPYGNEPGGNNQSQYLGDWVKHFKERDSRRLYTSASGWPQIAENQFHVTPEPRVFNWGEGLRCRINALPPETRTDYRQYIQARNVPVISHEIGQWCVFPNLEEISKYKGMLKAKNFEIFRDLLDEHHLGNRAKDFLMASGKLQTLCYKEDIESALRTPGMGGFELLDLHDFPGQGTALVGVLDPFWDSKGYVTPAEYSRFCNNTVPLARMSKRVFTNDETFTADVEVAHFGPKPLEEVVPAWKIVDSSGRTLLLGKLPMKTIPIDNGIALGTIREELKSLPAPAKYKIVVTLLPLSIPDPDRQPFENDWDIWVYPAQVDTSPKKEIHIAHELDETALAQLDAGGKVLLLVPPSRVKGDKHGKVGLGFSSIFWNTAWTNRQPPQTLGILCDPKHPALAEFPTEYHSNWQWWYLIHQAGAMVLDDLPAELKPTVSIIDDWFTCRRLGLIFEANVRRGKLLVCSIDLERELEKNPVARQMRHSLLDYMAGGKFQPQVELKPEQVQGLFTQPSAIERLGGRVSGADGFEPDYEPQKAIDGDPSTFWHTPWRNAKPGYPHEIRLGFKEPARLQGITLLFRQDGNPNGWIKDYAVSASVDGKDWGQPVAEGSFSHDDHLKTVNFVAPCEAKFLRITAKAGFGTDPFAAIAELDVIPTK